MDIHKILADTKDFWENFADTEVREEDLKIRVKEVAAKKFAFHSHQATFNANIAGLIAKTDGIGASQEYLNRAQETELKNYNSIMTKLFEGTVYYDKAQAALNKRAEKLKETAKAMTFTAIERKSKATKVSNEAAKKDAPPTTAIPPGFRLATHYHI